MKVLMINTGWKLSSTGKIAYGFYKELVSRGHECILLHREAVDEEDDKNVIALNKHIEVEIYRKINLVTGYHSTFAPLSMYRLRKIFEKFKPDIVQLYNIHGYFVDIYRMFDFFAKKQVPIVYSMLDEHPYLGYCCYAYDCEQFKAGCTNCNQRIKSGYMGSLFFNRARETFLLKEKAYKKNDIIFVGPRWVLERARESALLCRAHLEEVDEFIENEMTFIPRTGEEIRKELSIGEDDIMILNVAPSNDPRKGVEDFIRMAEKCKNEKFKFVNVGYQDKNRNLPNNFIGVSFVAEQQLLAEYYSASDALVCTSYADTMPNVCLEALSCGTPVYGYEVTGVPYVAEEPEGTFVQTGNIDAMLEKILDVGRKDIKTQERCRKYAMERYSLNVYTEKMMKIYKNKLKERKDICQ